MAGASEGCTGAAEACERDFAVWFGFAGAGPSESSSSESSSSDDDEEGRSPGAAALEALRAMAASFLALAAARRCSRVWAGFSSSSESEVASDEDSSSEDVSWSFCS